MITVAIMLNESTDGAGFFGYQPQHPMRRAFEVEVEAVDNNTLEWVFEFTNIDPRMTDDVDMRDLVRSYRAAGNRSLSVGDVVVLGENAYACERIGWIPVTLNYERVTT